MEPVYGFVILQILSYHGSMLTYEKLKRLGKNCLITKVVFIAVTRSSAVAESDRNLIYRLICNRSTLVHRVQESPASSA